MFIDTHCHLNFEAFQNDVGEVIKSAQEKGVTQFIIPGTNLKTSQTAASLAQTYPSCFAAIGIHPHHAKDNELIVDTDLKKKLLDLARQPRVVAIGEVGMDYFVYQKSKYPENEITSELKEKQKKLFLMHLEVAREVNLPVIFHCREASDDMISIIETFIADGNTVRGVFHCFGAGKKDLKKVLAMGFLVGIDGNITYNQNLQFIPTQTPLGKILLETDAPYLTPIPHRQERNTPGYLPLIAEYIAQQKSISVETIASTTTQNARSLFGLS